MNGEVILTWNTNLLNAIRRMGGEPGPISRKGAMMHIEMFDAVNHLTADSPYEPYLRACLEISF